MGLRGVRERGAEQLATHERRRPVEVGRFVRARTKGACESPCRSGGKQHSEGDEPDTRQVRPARVAAGTL